MPTTAASRRPRRRFVLGALLLVGAIALIGTGALKPGMQLPTVRQLAGFLRINRNTVARALANLHRDGYLECQQGRGTFVARQP